MRKSDSQGGANRAPSEIIQEDVDLSRVFPHKPPQELTVAIIGSREFKDYDYLYQQCMIFFSGLRRRAYKKKVNIEITIISGGARGADSLGERFAREREYRFKVFLPEFEKRKLPYPGPQDYFKRNTEIAAAANIVLGFLKRDLKNAGSLDTINKALRLEKEVHVFWS